MGRPCPSHPHPRPPTPSGTGERTGPQPRPELICAPPPRPFLPLPHRYQPGGRVIPQPIPMRQAWGEALTILGLPGAHPEPPGWQPSGHPRTQAPLRPQGLTCGCSGHTPAGTRGAGGLVRMAPDEISASGPGHQAGGNCWQRTRSWGGSLGRGLPSRTLPLAPDHSRPDCSPCLTASRASCGPGSGARGRGTPPGGSPVPDQ